MTPELRAEIVKVKRSGVSPRQVVLIMNARGVEITMEAVRYAVLTQRWKDRENARRKRQAATRQRQKERQRRQKLEKAARAEQAMAADVRARYLRFGCRVSENGKVRLPRMEAAE